MDEFSRFLNEFEDELRTDKKKIDKDVTAASESPANVTTSATVTSAAESGTSAAAPAKRPRLETERKVVNGKRMRKKVRERTPSMSPEGGKIERRQSPLRVSPSFNRYLMFRIYLEVTVPPYRTGRSGTGDGTHCPHTILRVSDMVKDDLLPYPNPVIFCSIVSDPHWFQCGSGSSILSQCGSGSRI